MGSPTPRLSVVVATYNRRELIARLARQLAQQTLPPSEYEVVVVDDGSKESPKSLLDSLQVPYVLKLVQQTNAGAAAARHRGVLEARAPVVIITDDDMQVERTFLECHLKRHLDGQSRVVLGRILPDPALASMPLFERWYAYLLDKHVAAIKSGKSTLRGTSLFTGNVSMRREDYLATGGFDLTLGQSEDAELGLRLEKLGAQFVLEEEAFTLHGSDHTSYDKWIKRAHRYGVYDLRIARKHPESPHANPYRFLFNLNPLARPLLVAALVLPESTSPISEAAMKATTFLDEAGMEKLAFAGTSLVYTMEYYRGLRDEAQSLGSALKDLAAYATHQGKARLGRAVTAPLRWIRTD